MGAGRRPCLWTALYRASLQAAELVSCLFDLDVHPSVDGNSFEIVREMIQVWEPLCGGSGNT